MTGKQLKTMLVYEGLFYALGAAAISLALSLIHISEPTRPY